jgi:hypothetical protein
MSVTPIPIATPIQFIVDKSQLDMMTMYIYIGIAGIIAFFILLIYVIQDKYRTPKQASNMTMAHRKHIPMILLAGLDHFADFLPIKEFIPQVLETNTFGKGAKKRSYRFGLPQKVNVAEHDIPVVSGKSEHATKQWIQGLNDLNNLRLTLRGVDAPLFVGTKNRTIAASIPFLSGLTLTKDVESLTKDGALIQALKDAKDERLRNVGDILGRLATGVSGVDFHAVYKNIDINYDPTTDESLKERYMTDGRMERADDKDKPTKIVLYLIMGALGMGILLVVAAYMLGGGGG